MTTYRLKKITELQTARLLLTVSRNLREEEAVDVRGYLGRRFSDQTLLHHHKGNGLIYTYPRIQCKVIDGKAVIIGIAEGVHIVRRMSERVDSLVLGNEFLRVSRQELRNSSTKFGSIKGVRNYFFLTPWLALNEENHRRYKTIRTRERQKMLEKILIGNILSMAKGLEYVVTEPLKAEVSVHEMSTKLKDIAMIGFLGGFRVNFEIPDLLGLGKSVSRGFGTVIKVRNRKDGEIPTSAY